MKEQPPDSDRFDQKNHPDTWGSRGCKRVTFGPVCFQGGSFVTEEDR